MSKIKGVSREELEKVVEMSLLKGKEWMAKMERRIFEKAGMPYDSQQEISWLLEILQIPLYAGHLTDLLMGRIGKEEYYTKLKQIYEKCLDSLGFSFYTEILNEKIEIEKKYLDEIGNSSYLLPFWSKENSTEKDIQYIQTVLQLAKEKHISPIQVIADDELYKESIRRSMTREEFLKSAKKLVEELEGIVGNVFDTKFGVVREIYGDEIYRKLKEETLKDSSFQQLKEIIKCVMEEEAKEIYG